MPAIMATAPVELSTGPSSWRLAISTRAQDEIQPAPAASTIGRASVAEQVSNDLDVVQAVLGGDREAFRVLVERESAMVVRTCYRVLRDLPEAEDVAQETFVIAYRSLATWRGGGPFGAWLARIAVRLAVRQLGRRRSVAWIGGSAASHADGALSIVPAGSRLQPEHAVVAAEDDLAVRRAVASLEEPYREVVALRFFAERSLDEISALTGRPLGTVKTHLRRGLLRLRERLADEGGA
jgi:RNA polymerase sigma-70 factor (ECF subfamily)